MNFGQNENVGWCRPLCGVLSSASFQKDPQLSNLGERRWRYLGNPDRSVSILFQCSLAYETHQSFPDRGGTNAILGGEVTQLHLFAGHEAPAHHRGSQLLMNLSGQAFA